MLLWLNVNLLTPVSLTQTGLRRHHRVWITYSPARQLCVPRYSLQHATLFISFCSATQLSFHATVFFLIIPYFVPFLKLAYNVQLFLFIISLFVFVLVIWFVFSIWFVLSIWFVFSIWFAWSCFKSLSFGSVYSLCKSGFSFLLRRKCQNPWVNDVLFCYPPLTVLALQATLKLSWIISLFAPQKVASAKTTFRIDDKVAIQILPICCVSFLSTKWFCWHVSTWAVVPCQLWYKVLIVRKGKKMLCYPGQPTLKILTDQSQI